MISLSNLVRKNIWNLIPYSSARDEFSGEADVYLDANENPFPNEGLNRYPDPMSRDVKNKLSLLKQVPSDQIFLGNGSDEVVDILIRIFCEPGLDHIITLPPTYGMYQVSADVNNILIKKVLLTDDFQPVVHEIRAATNEHSKILFICTPNNPTGNQINVSIVEELLNTFPGIVVIDEAYSDFSSEPSWSARLDAYPQLVVMQTFSKAWGLAGIRLGMAFAGKEIIDLMNKVKPPYNVNLLTQAAALSALDHPERMESDKAAILKQRVQLESDLKTIPFVLKVYPSDANFLLVKVADADRVYQFLVSRGVVVRNRNTVPRCEGCLRMTVGTPEENERLMTAMYSFFNS